MQSITSVARARSELHNSRKTSMNPIQLSPSRPARALAEIGPRILWGYLEKKMFEIAPHRDLSRSLELTVNLPTEIVEIYSMVSECLQSIGEPTRATFDIKLKDWKEGFVDVNLKEKELQDFVTKRIESDVRTQEFTRKFDKLARNLIKKFPKFNLS